ncbi:unnamed protein product [Euphydryas editha]|uniref:DNA repair endonuclease XPF n=1 Tax=Euphydryas editha TaxID=104508 RepID=A0AAU9VAF3_EUPED|nr:unnamed protein product [Euphydryas editha]
MEKSDENEDLQHNIETMLPLLPYEKQIFMEMVEKDALLIIAKGLNYNDVVANILWVHKDPANLVLVINSNEFEEIYFNQKLNLTVLPTVGNEREKAYLEGGVYFVSTRILVVDLLKNRVPVSHITGIIVLRAHTVLESCQEAFVLRLFRQKNKTGFIKAFSNSPISFTFGYHQVEKVMRSLFVTELYLWPRFHGAIIKSLKSRQAEVIEIHVPLTSNMGLIQSCLLDIMNYTVKQLKSINRTLDMQKIVAFLLPSFPPLTIIPLKLLAVKHNATPGGQLCAVLFSKLFNITVIYLQSMTVVKETISLIICSTVTVLNPYVTFANALQPKLLPRRS